MSPASNNFTYIFPVWMLLFALSALARTSMLSRNRVDRLSFPVSYFLGGSIQSLNFRYAGSYRFFIDAFYQIEKCLLLICWELFFCFSSIKNDVRLCQRFSSLPFEIIIYFSNFSLLILWIPLFWFFLTIKPTLSS